MQLAPRRGANLALALLAVCATGCATARYLTQAAAGQYELLHVARPIAEVVEDPKTPRRLAALLSHVDDVKAFARGQGLTPTTSYSRYADLKRPAAVWVVQACAPLSFDVHHWTFPIVGSVPYLGFFDEAAARAEAAALAQSRELDIVVRTASAYSTLGWFRDPVLSTMISDADDALGDLVNVVLHESVHATVYVKDQSLFDESLASFVADRLTLTWLGTRPGLRSKQAQAWIRGHARYRSRLDELRAAWLELDALYRSGVDDTTKRARKAEVYAALTARLRLATPLNNATLSGFRTYAIGTGGFERLLAACGGFKPMLDAVGTLEARDFSRPQQEDFEPVVDALARTACAKEPRSPATPASMPR